VHTFAVRSGAVVVYDRVFEGDMAYLESPSFDFCNAARHAASMKWLPLLAEFLHLLQIQVADCRLMVS
jgi:hypothetical protein